MIEQPPKQGVHQLRVRYVECDPMGVAHHSSYLPWMEIGRTELLRAVGASYAELEAAGVFLVITKCALKYRRPIKYDDLIEIRTKVDGASKVKLNHSYEIALVERMGKSADEVCAIGETELACVGSDGKIRVLPDWLRGS